MINLRNSSLNEYHSFFQGIGPKFNLYTYSVSPTLCGYNSNVHHCHIFSSYGPQRKIKHAYLMLINSWHIQSWYDIADANLLIDAQITWQHFASMTAFCKYLKKGFWISPTIQVNNIQIIPLKFLVKGEMISMISINFMVLYVIIHITLMQDLKKVLNFHKIKS
jgi:hypothetical protein